MATCPNCGEIVMEGDPYCPNCGTAFRWVHDGEYERASNDRDADFNAINEAYDLRDEIKRILRRMFLDDYQILMLTSKALSLMESNGCSLYGIREENDGAVFYFKKENEFLSTRYECPFSPDFLRVDRVFFDCIVYTNFDRLENDSRFKKAVRDVEMRTGFTFSSCGGGYDDVDMDMVSGDFTFKDTCRVFARFKTPEGKIELYDVDLDRMTLTERQ